MRVFVLLYFNLNPMSNNIDRPRTIEEMLSNPKVGDVYCFKKKSLIRGTRYMVLKIVAIDGEAITAYRTRYTYPESSPVLHDKDYFLTSEPMTNTIPTVLNLYKTGILVSAQRNYPKRYGYDRER